MNTTDFIKLLQNPDVLTPEQTSELEVVLTEFPYFQSAGAIRLKGLYKQSSFRYNLELKKTAAQTTDRTVLFDFITSEHSKVSEVDIHQIEVFDTEIVSAHWVTPEEKLEQSLITSIKSAEVKQNVEEQNFQEDNLEVGKPIAFTPADRFSFDQWLELTKTNTITSELVKEKPEKEFEKNQIPDPDKLKKLALIDKFIEANPKITPDKNTPAPPVIDAQHQDSPKLMTETLAKVYLEQKKYQKAIDAYEILILKYPEKSVFFADRIQNIKKLQQNNI